MGGVATCVNKKDSDSVLMTKEGEDKDEYIITRHSQFLRPINVINVYGEQENRNSKECIEKRWMRLRDEVSKIEAKNEAVILIGDLNKHVGNGSLGISGNHPKVSFGGKLVQELLADQK